MHPIILHVSGPPASGKTTLARALALRAHPYRPHFIRFDLRDQPRMPSLRIPSPPDEMASAAFCFVSTNLVFEQVSEVLCNLTSEAEDDHAMIIVETDSHPCFRHAYPYHAKVFVMRPPASLDVVFRSPAQTATAIQKAMDDTAEFAAEMFGLERWSQDSAVLPAVEPKDRRAQPGPYQSVEEFLDSAVGTEIATRMHLQPEYHPIIESDVVVLNEAVEHDPETSRQCAEKLEFLLEHLRRRLDRQPWFAVCDPSDERDPLAERALQKIEALLSAAKDAPDERE